MPSAYGPGFGTVGEPRLVYDHTQAGVTPLYLVYTGEGYQAAEYTLKLRPRIIAAIKNLLLFQKPFDSLKISFQLWEVPVNSQDSGVSLDLNVDNRQKHTYFGLAAGEVINLGTLRAVCAAALSEYALPNMFCIGLVNGPGYYGLATGSSGLSVLFGDWPNSLTEQTLWHEMGHMLARLTDEYDNGSSGIASRSVEDSWATWIGVHGEIGGGGNVTGNFDLTKILPDPLANVPWAGGRAQVRWAALVTDSGGWPTWTLASGWAQPIHNRRWVGAFEGGYYSRTSWLRSSERCRMRDGTTDVFCEVCCSLIRLRLTGYCAP